MRARRTSRLVLAVLFLVGGALHFVIPAAYARIVPPYLPWPMALVYVSGVAEIAGGVGLLVERTRRAAGMGLVLLLLAVLPANVQMVLDAQASGAAGWAELLLWMRLPLQFALIAWVAWAAEVRRRPGPGVVVPREG